MMNLHLFEISTAVSSDAHAILIAHGAIGTRLAANCASQTTSGDIAGAGLSNGLAASVSCSRPVSRWREGGAGKRAWSW
jgi:hypothetical protein